MCLISKKKKLRITVYYASLDVGSRGSDWAASCQVFWDFNKILYKYKYDIYLMEYREEGLFHRYVNDSAAFGFL
jgi:hypothetical protein